MIHKLDKNFKKIVGQILEEGKSAEEWAEVESDDMFQEGNYEGGFDATEMDFCFSVYLEDKEYWFQLSLEQIKKIESGEITKLEVNPRF